MDDRERGFVRLLFTTDGATLAFLLIAASGTKLPAQLPMTFGPVLPFRSEIVLLGACIVAAAALLLAELFCSGSSRYRRLVRWGALVLFIASTAGIASAGLKILRHPQLLR